MTETVTDPNASDLTKDIAGLGTEDETSLKDKGKEKEKADDTDREAELSEEEKQTEEELKKQLEADEEEELKEEDKEEVEEETKEEETEIKDYPTYKAVSDKYPKIFKDFPNLKDLFAHGFEYRRMFPTIKDAKEATDKVDVFDEMESTLMQGDPKFLLETVKKTDEKALLSLAENFLPSLAEKSKEAYVVASTAVIDDLIRLMHADGTARKDENLQNVALHIAAYIHGTGEDGKVQIPKKGKIPTDPEFEKRKKELDDRENSIAVSQFNTFRDSVFTKARKILEQDIVKAIDPENKLYGEFHRKAIVEQIRKEVGDLLGKNKDHLANMDSLWAKAAKEGFEDGWKTRIILAYLGGARKILPTIRNRVVAEFKGERSKPATKTKERVPSSGAVSESSKAPKTDEIKTAMKSGKSDMDILSMD